MEEDQMEDSGPVTDSFVEKRMRRDRSISHERRVQLTKLAAKLAADVLELTKPHERCLLRRMTENLLPDEDD